MKVSRLEQLYAAIIMVIFGLIVIHAPINVGFGTLFPDFGLFFKSWKEILMVIALPIAAGVITRRRLWRTFLRDPLFCVIIGYVVLHFVTIMAFNQGIAATLAGLAIDLRYIAFFGLVYVLLQAIPSYGQQMIIVGSVGAVAVVGFAVLQLFLPPDILVHIGYGKDTIAPYLVVDKNPDYVRVNSTLRGPNPLGAYVGIVLAFLAAAWTRGIIHTKRSAIFAAVLGLGAVVALWISYSRSALLAAVVAVVIVAAVGLRRLSRTTWIGFVVIICSLSGAVIASQGSSVISNVLFHENPAGGSPISSNDQHVQSLSVGLDHLVRQPLGVGVGTTGSASLRTDQPLIIENQYLFVAHETGWAGLVLFIAMFVIILTRAWNGRKNWLCLGVFASGVGLGIIGILQPVWVDDTVSIVWWGLAAIAIAGGGYARKSSE